MKKLPIILATAALMLGAVPTFAADADAPATALVANGNFETDADGNGQPEGWPIKENVTWAEEGGNHFIRLKSPEPGVNVMVYKLVALKPAEQKALQLTYKVRYDNLKPGAELWF